MEVIKFNNKIENKQNNEDQTIGMALSISFLLISLFFYLNLMDLGHESIAYILFIISFVIGIIGLGLELNDLFKNPSKPKERSDGLGLDEIGIGFGFGFIGLILYFKMNFIVINYINIIIIFFSFIFILSGLMKWIQITFLSKFEFKIQLKIKKIILSIVTLISFISGLITIYEFISK